MRISNKPPLLFILLSIFILLCSCSTIIQSTGGKNLPIFSQDELIRPYIKLGRIQVTREVYGSDAEVTANITDWGIAALRYEAEKMGADAVMLPEVSGRTTTYNIFPSTEYRATGFAIKFR